MLYLAKVIRYREHLSQWHRTNENEDVLRARLQESGLVVKEIIGYTPETFRKVAIAQAKKVTRPINMTNVSAMDYYHRETCNPLQDLVDAYVNNSTRN